MSDIVANDKNIYLSVNNAKDEEMICKIARALAVPDRLRILKSLLNHTKSISDLSAELDIPISSVSRHVDTLADAQLIFIKYEPGIKGHTKYCSQMVNNCNISLETPDAEEVKKESFALEMPVGMYTDCNINSPCGMTGKEGALGPYDDPRAFLLPERAGAECIWFSTGFVSYNFPIPRLKFISQLEFTFEICSEAVYYNNFWPSDITIKINDREIITFTSPGDFGGRRGKFTPDYWPITSTQFGLLKKLSINSTGVYLDNCFMTAAVTIQDLKILNGDCIKFSIGIKDDAVHRGGLNLFGKNFGDYDQAIVMTIE